MRQVREGLASGGRGGDHQREKYRKKHQKTGKMTRFKIKQEIR